MQKAKVKTKKIKSNRDFVKLFNQMIGLEDVPSDQIASKYENLIKASGRFLGCWEIFVKSKFIKLSVKPEFKAVITEIEEFIVRSTEELKTFEIPTETSHEKREFSSSIEEALINMAGNYDNKKLNNAFRGLKKSKLLESIIITYERIESALQLYKKKTNAALHCLEDKTMSNKFIIDHDIDTKFLAFSNLDFRFLYECFPEEPVLNDLILLTLHFAHFRGKEIYNIYISPDIDVEKFSESFIKRIDDLKKTVPDCNEAFNLIKKSVKLLETNFDEYYKQFIATKNPGIIFEGFLGDVAKASSSTIKVKSQIAKIISQVKAQLIKSGQMSEEAKSLSNYAEEIMNKLSDDK